MTKFYLNKIPNFSLKIHPPFSFHLFVGTNDDQHEIQRQNRITEQILTNYLERKIFGKPKNRAPTIEEILPPDAKPTPSNVNNHTTNDEDDPETDNLQSVESEHVDSFYRDYEGRLK